MCDVCRNIPCLPGCPNAPGPAAEYTCSKCGGGIYPDDEYLDMPGEKVCIDCLEDMTVGELLRYFGEELSTA